jgi:hypothetical protein
MGQHLWEDFQRGQKPLEISWGIYTHAELRKKLLPKDVTEEKKAAVRHRLDFARRTYARAVQTKHVKDLLLKKKKARLVRTEKAPCVDYGNVLVGFDIRSCRVNALLQRDRPLPVFSPLDELIPFRRDVLPKADFIWVEAEGAPFPYSGSMLYTSELAQHMLEIGAIEMQDCKYSLTASNHVGTSDLAKHFETIKQVFASAAYDRLLEVAG